MHARVPGAHGRVRPAERAGDRRLGARDRPARAAGITLDYIRPGKPVDNAFIESFNGKLRDECLDEQYFLDLADARQTIERWRQHDNRARPHSSLGRIPPAAHAARFTPDPELAVLKLG